MRHSRGIARGVLVAALVVFAACSDDPPLSPTPTATVLDQTPRDDEEAEAAALYLSEELVAPQDLYVEIDSALAAIRDEFADSTRLLQLYFRPPWRPGYIFGRYTPEATKEIRAGTFTGTDALDAYLRLVEMDTTSFQFDSTRLFFERTFEGRLHPDRVAEMYEALPAVESATDGWIVFDGSNVYPWRIDDGLSFLFREAWGDCPSWCIWSRFWYFRVVDGAVEFVGYWDTSVDGWSNPPPWWDEAKAAFDCRWADAPSECP